MSRGGSIVANTAAITAVAARYLQESGELQLHLQCSNRVSASQFTFNFNKFTEAESLLRFRFQKKDIARVASAVGWPQHQTSTLRNPYRVNSLLSACVILRRLASPARWEELEIMFGEHASQLSEIFWEGIENFIEKRAHLLTSPINAKCMSQHVHRYATAIHQKCGGLSNCVSFIDGTVIDIARPKGFDVQRVVYNGHKRKHALKFQVISSPDGLILHAYGPIEGSRHVWTLYTRSGIEEHLPNILQVSGVKYCIYGDSGYNRPWFLEVPFQGSNLAASRHAFNKTMSSVRNPVEWIFKEVKLYFTTVNYKRKLKVFKSPVASHYLAAMLLTNIRNCVYRNQIARYFDFSPPLLEQYLLHRF